MIQVYANPPAIKSLEKARQGYIEVLQDIENHVIGTNDSRVHEEEQGYVLCQADNQKQSWHCADRFVYGMDDIKERALCVGHVIDHQRKGFNDYREKRKIAKKTKNSDFDDTIFLSSELITQRMQSVADEMTPPQEPPRIEILKKAYFDLVSEGTEGKELFQKILAISLDESGPITNSEKRIVRNLPKTNPFRIEMEKILPIKKKNSSIEKTSLDEKIDHIH